MYKGVQYRGWCGIEELGNERVDEEMNGFIRFNSFVEAGISIW